MLLKEATKQKEYKIKDKDQPVIVQADILTLKLKTK
jgi:hypothetical protein